MAASNTTCLIFKSLQTGADRERLQRANLMYCSCRVRGSVYSSERNANGEDQDKYVAFCD